MDMPRPDAEHEKLARLAGTWTGVENMHPSQWMPNGAEASGVTTSRVAVGGFTVVTDYEQRMGGQVTFVGHGVYTVDPRNQNVVLYWFDSMAGQCEVFRGSWDGDSLALFSENPMMGHLKLTYEFQSDDTMNSAMDCSQDGEAWNRLFDSVYTRSER
ncbi:MAG: DUF1579 family protein [Planctomycetes bacterium]|nr:DUF1579 family protein [Planctomycetota bacterium]